MAQKTPESQVVARIGSPQGVMEVLPHATAGGDPFGVIDSRLAATATAQGPIDAHHQTPTVSVGAADSEMTNESLQGPEFYIPKHTVYLPIRIGGHLVLKTLENNKLWEATNEYLKTLKNGIVYRLEKDHERPCSMDGKGREPYLPWGHRIYGTTDDSNWVKIVGKNPKPNFDQFSTMMKAFPESPDRP